MTSCSRNRILSLDHLDGLFYTLITVANTLFVVKAKRRDIT